MQAPAPQPGTSARGGTSPATAPSRVRLSRGFATLLALCAGLLAGACSTQPLEPPSGQEVFATHCAACHGPVGEGDGPVAATFRATVPDLRSLDERFGGQFPDDLIASYIDGRDLPDAHGARLMPVWGDVFEATEQVVPGAAPPETRIEALLRYLRTIQY